MIADQSPLLEAPPRVGAEFQVHVTLSPKSMSIYIPPAMEELMRRRWASGTRWRVVEAHGFGSPWLLRLHPVLRNGMKLSRYPNGGFRLVTGVEQPYEFTFRQRPFRAQFDRNPDNMCWTLDPAGRPGEWPPFQKPE